MDRIIAPVRTILAAMLLLGSVSALAQEPAAPTPVLEAEPKPELALMGTIPIFWGEAGDISELIGGGYHQHWAREALERGWQLAPLSYLSAAALASHEHLLLAQPRGLSPEENVALDDWVAAGGKLLLFADPMMTGHSDYGLGDRRRPQDVAVLSPILARWGLGLEFDADDPAGLGTEDYRGTQVPVALPGRFVRQEGGVAECAIEGDGLIARCTRGAGRVVLVADAALLDLAGPHPGAEAALERLVERAFAEDGEIAGEGVGSASEAQEIPVSPPVIILPSFDESTRVEGNDLR